MLPALEITSCARQSKLLTTLVKQTMIIVGATPPSLLTIIGLKDANTAVASLTVGAQLVLLVAVDSLRGPHDQQHLWRLST